MYNANINQQVRDYLTDVLTVPRLHSPKEVYEKRVITVMNDIEKSNPKMYRAFLGTIFSDYYKMLYSRKVKKETTVEEEGCLIFFDSLTNVNTLSQELKLLPELTVDMVNETLDFNELKYFDKRKIFIQNKPKNPFLQSINPNHFIDQVYYCQSYDPNKFISIYNKMIRDKQNEDKEALKIMAVESLNSLYEQLRMCDHPSTKKLGYAMLRDYYIYKKYDSSLEKPSEYDKNMLRMIEKSNADDIPMLSEEPDFSQVTKSIIQGFIEYNTEKSDEYKYNAGEYLKNNVSKTVKTKLNYNKRRKTV